MKVVPHTSNEEAPLHVQRMGKTIEENVSLIFLTLKPFSEVDHIKIKDSRIHQIFAYSFMQFVTALANPFTVTQG